MIFRFVQDNASGSMIDLGCGDGSQLALLEPPDDYVGVEVSQTTLARCAARFGDRRFVAYEQSGLLPSAGLTLSLYLTDHLVEDSVFVAMVQRLFVLATHFLLIYAGNADVHGRCRTCGTGRSPRTLPRPNRIGGCWLSPILPI